MFIVVVVIVAGNLSNSIFLEILDC